MAASATAKASQSMSAVGEKIGSLADVIRDKAPHEGAVGSAATTVANKLDAAGAYLQEKKVDHMVGDLTSMIRRYPIPALLIGLGIGYLLAGRTRR
jgi:type II secretory pathway component PulF